MEISFSHCLSVFQTRTPTAFAYRVLRHSSHERTGNRTNCLSDSLSFFPVHGPKRPHKNKNKNNVSRFSFLRGRAGRAVVLSRVFYAFDPPLRYSSPAQRNWLRLSTSVLAGYIVIPTRAAPKLPSHIILLKKRSTKLNLRRESGSG
ncbi:hypothetical protein BDBG_17077 [Blastomyces gilchristii SLH14081]|uniref:Uncharacterized protein n=1 Tax=Blastomyces gilchristii (strain SLH14081) TaxID=559298 RepID=A0A179UKL5_BLAGS|nr:uncharacterized protein BDBG_17077 [Blastomyces gilchristii SLH14081]OAT08595.1 hypothetical protein BDBG_17077 [Blastomyces gilchristii SLH14081]